MLNFNNSPLLSIIICTYNRCTILNRCLQCFLHQNTDQTLYEILVIDNNSTDDTQSVVEKLKKQIPIRYYKETQIGLSYARNKGALEANADWLYYIDDDTFIQTNTISRAINTIQNYQFHCFGGPFNAYYLDKKPKWLPNDFGSLHRDGYKEPGITESFYNTGLNILFQKTALNSVNNFPINLGMTGNKVAYGEEAYVQKMLKEKGFKIGYDPLLEVSHLVGKHKLKLSWHLKSAYAQGRDHEGWLSHNKKSLYHFLRAFESLFRINTFKGLKKIFTQKDYYVQNFILDVAKPILILLGQYSK